MEYLETCQVEGKQKEKKYFLHSETHLHLIRFMKYNECCSQIVYSIISGYVVVLDSYIL